LHRLRPGSENGRARRPDRAHGISAKVRMSRAGPSRGRNALPQKSAAPRLRWCVAGIVNRVDTGLSTWLHGVRRL